MFIISSLYDSRIYDFSNVFKHDSRAVYRINRVENTNWCNTLTNLLTKKATELENDVAFSELVEALQLKDDLLAV